MKGAIRRGSTVVLAATGLLFASSLVLSADTLQLKNGDVVQGKYLGGSERVVQFEVGGKIELYEVDRILSITFTKPSQQSQAVPDSYKPPVSIVKPPSDHPLAAGATVPAGTHVLVRMIDGVDSANNHVGDRFHASLENDLMADDVVIAPKGADVYGRLSEAQEAGRIAGKAQLKLELTDVLINNKLQPIYTGDYEVSGKGRGTNTAEKAAGGAVLGTIVGAIAGGGRGAAAGAAIGAGAGTTINIVTKGEEVRVPSETVLDFRLDQPFTVSRP